MSVLDNAEVEKIRALVADLRQVARETPGKRLEGNHDTVTYSIIYRGADALETLLLSHTDAVTVPDGWKLVPVEPTREMDEILDVMTDGRGGQYARKRWAELLAAALQPPASLGAPEQPKGILARLDPEYAEKVIRDIELYDHPNGDVHS